MGDKSYDADAILVHLEHRGVAAVIPPKRNRKVQPVIDGHRQVTHAFAVGALLGDAKSRGSRKVEAVTNSCLAPPFPPAALNEALAFHALA